MITYHVETNAGRRMVNPEEWVHCCPFCWSTLEKGGAPQYGILAIMADGTRLTATHDDLTTDHPKEPLHPSRDSDLFMAICAHAHNHTDGDVISIDRVEEELWPHYCQTAMMAMVMAGFCISTERWLPKSKKLGRSAHVARIKRYAEMGVSLKVCGPDGETVEKTAAQYIDHWGEWPRLPEFLPDESNAG